ncbi:MAG: lipoxygenase family protein [Gammaproteobacteria bacterium]|nr:lipoxygenase family protein [Gammaproteobacteria bacterium]
MAQNSNDPYQGAYGALPGGAWDAQKAQCNESAETTEENHELNHITLGYCDTHFSIGTSFRQDPMYPFPLLRHRAEACKQDERDAEIQQAKLDNTFNSELLPGAVVHGNIGAQDVRENAVWTLRGTQAQRDQFAQEASFGIDDAVPAENATDLLESMFPYIEKNWRLWAQNPDKLNGLMALATGAATDGQDANGARITLLSPVLTTYPEVWPDDVCYWDFYPEKFPDRYPKQPFHDEHQDDDVIGWLQLAASSPYSPLKPYKQHQANFAYTNAMFTGLAPFASDNLDQAMAEGRVFIVDFKHYHEDNIKPPAAESGARFFTPIALFAVAKTGGALKLLAIQPTQHTPQNQAEYDAWVNDNTQDPERPLSELLTPNDDFWSWQMAKTCFMSMYAISNVVDHLSTHVYLGAIPVAFYRNIPKQHPLTALLEPHFMSLSLNNHAGIFWEQGQAWDEYGETDEGFLTGMADKISGWSGQTFIDSTVRTAGRYDFYEYSTPLNRETDTDFAAIEDFPLHDDELGLFDIIKRWVDGYLRLYYRYDSDVVNDQELQGFCFEPRKQPKVAGFTESVRTINEMVDTIARVIYWMTNNHALEATLGAQHIAPVGYFSDRVPRKGETKTEQDWLNILPPINRGMATFIASRVFVDLPQEWHRSLGKYPQGQFMHDQRVYKYLKVFQDDIFELNEKIKTRNQSRRWEYNLKRPATMTVSPWN